MTPPALSAVMNGGKACRLCGVGGILVRVARERSVAVKSTRNVVRRSIKSRRTSIPPARRLGAGGSTSQLLKSLSGASKQLQQSRRPMRGR